MNTDSSIQRGWKPIPMSLKILFVLLLLWAIGSFFAIPMRHEQGIPLFGFYVYGFPASITVALLDLIGPIAFLYALWYRKLWGITVASIYIGIFILNSAIAAFTFSEKLGMGPILIPAIVNAIFLFLIYRKTSYFIDTNS